MCTEVVELWQKKKKRHLFVMTRQKVVLPCLCICILSNGRNDAKWIGVFTDKLVFSFNLAQLQKCLIMTFVRFPDYCLLSIESAIFI